jgi:hypothetical protein
VNLPVAKPGSVVAGRYRLEEPLVIDPESSSSEWRAFDPVLARPVAIRMLPTSDPRAAKLLDAARAAGQVNGACLAQVYDADEDGDQAYLVTEWLDDSLEGRLLRTGPLDPDAAAALLIELARTVSLAHRAGLSHQHLAPTAVFFTSSGSVRLTGLATANALNGVSGVSDGVAVDVRGLGLLLYAALTARWPGDPSDSALPAAPRSEAHLRSPGQVRAGIPRELDTLTITLLPEAAPPRNHVPLTSRPITPITSAAGVETALAALALSAPEAATEKVPPLTPEEARSPGHRRRIPRSLKVAIPLALAAAVGGAIWAAAHQLGAISFPDHEPGPSATVPASGVGVIPLQRVFDFDPGGDGKENPQQVPLAHDGNPSTAWQTETYTTANFGNLKTGLGLVVDLGSPQEVVTVSLQLVGDGTSLELRAGDSPPTTGDSLPVVASASDASGTTVLHPQVGTRARYWVVWLTKLPAVSDGYRGGIAEMAFQR